MLDIYIYLEYNMNDMNINNKIRCYFIFISIISLCLGLMIYIFLRDGTFIHSALPSGLREAACEVCKKTGNNFFADFLRYYFADFLWCLSLNFALLAVAELKSKKTLYTIAMISAFLGVVFEFAQYIGLTSGTFDFIDIFMYIIASVSAVAISIKILKRTELI